MNEDIIGMSLEAKMFYQPQAGWIAELHHLERFAALVAAAEREACAKAVEDYCGAWDDKGYALASAIRARGEK